MSTKNTKRGTVRLQVLRDKTTGRVFAAGPTSFKPLGDDGPDQVRFVASEGEICEEIELTREQAQMAPRELFASHVVRRGRLVPDSQAE